MQTCFPTTGIGFEMFHFQNDSMPVVKHTLNTHAGQQQENKPSITTARKDMAQSLICKKN